MNHEIDAYIKKQKSPQKEICQKLRKILFATFPDISEEMKWGVPAYADGKYYIVALKTHVNLGFSTQGLSADEIAGFDGGGKTTKHIKIDSVKNIDQTRIITLLKLVQSKT